jgi:hypothetical protein
MNENAKELINIAQVLKEIAVSSAWSGGPDSDFYWAKAKKAVKLAFNEDE